MKILICCAHPGEAQTFLKNLKARPRAFFFDKLYESDQALILLTGEGPQNASERVSAVLAAFHFEISMVVNFGVCAEILGGQADSPHHLPGTNGQPSLVADDVRGYWIRTSYLARPGVNAGGFEFRSFTSQEILEKPNKDCVSVFERMFDSSVAARLSIVAPLVDRELWGLASACQTMKKPFCSYKLISDRVYADLNPNEEGENSGGICQIVREKAELYSDHFFEIWKKTFQVETSDLRFAPGLTKHFLLDDPDFHFTTSMRNHFLKNLHRLELGLGVGNKGIISEKPINSNTANHPSSMDFFYSLKYEELKKEKMPSKDRARELLNRMDEKLNPLDHAWKMQMEELLKPLEKNGIQCVVKEETEDIEIRIQHNLRNNLANTISKLNNFNWDNLRSLLDGHFDV